MTGGATHEIGAAVTHQIALTDLAQRIREHPIHLVEAALLDQDSNESLGNSSKLMTRGGQAYLTLNGFVSPAARPQLFHRFAEERLRLRGGTEEGGQVRAGPGRCFRAHAARLLSALEDLAP